MTDITPSGKTRIDLKYPVTHDGLTCAHLELRRPKVRDLLYAEKRGGSDAEREINQIASLAGVAPALIEDLDMVDYIALQNAVKAFLA